MDTDTEQATPELRISIPMSEYNILQNIARQFRELARNNSEMIERHFRERIRYQGELIARLRSRIDDDPPSS